MHLLMHHTLLYLLVVHPLLIHPLVLRHPLVLQLPHRGPHWGRPWRWSEGMMGGMVMVLLMLMLLVMVMVMVWWVPPERGASWETSQPLCLHRPCPDPYSIVSCMLHQVHLGHRLALPPP